MGIAIITGGNRGLGADTAHHLAQKGHNVILTYHNNKDEGEAVAAAIERTGRKAAALRLDVADTASFPAFAQAVAAKLKDWNETRFDFLVNNAGIGIHASLAETTEDQFDSLMAVHFKGPVFLTNALLPLMRDGGRIVNISSGLSRFTVPGYAAYAAMKGAMEVVTRYQAKELGPRGISAITLAPGPVATDFGGGAVRDNPQINAFLASQTALGRVGMPEDIGGAIAALLSEESRWINGQRIEASGGMCL